MLVFYGILSGTCSGILLGKCSGTLSGIHSGRTLPSGTRGNTAILHLRLRSGGEHCHPELAVEDDAKVEEEEAEEEEGS